MKIQCTAITEYPLFPENREVLSSNEDLVLQKLFLKYGEINNNTVVGGAINIPLTLMDISTKQRINKETQTLNDTMVQLDLIDIYKTFHPKTMNFTFFSSAHGTFSRVDDILGYKSSLG